MTLAYRKVGDHGQCEVHDLIRTEDDAVDVRCPFFGRVIRETYEFRDGGARLRCVCAKHGLVSAMTVN